MIAINQYFLDGFLLHEMGDGNGLFVSSKLDISIIFSDRRHIVIVTDCELALLRCIAATIIRGKNTLCTWHIQKMLLASAGSLWFCGILGQLSDGWVHLVASL